MGVFFFGRSVDECTGESIGKLESLFILIIA
jgi:hypothetical protein